MDHRPEVNLSNRAGRTSVYLDYLSKFGNRKKRAEKVRGERVRRYGWQKPGYEVPYWLWKENSWVSC